MTARAVFLLAVTALAARGQLQIVTVVGLEERPAAGIINLGITPTGEPLDVLFRVRNTGPSLATVQVLTIEGEGFRLHLQPAVPFHLVPDRSADFYVRFVSDQATQGARGTLRINTASMTVIAGATAVANLYVVEDDGTRTRRLAGQSTVFAPTERGSVTRRRFLLENPHPMEVPLVGAAVSGESFSLTSALPERLAPAATFPFEIAFRPAASGLNLGSLMLDGRRFPLEGVAREPPLPRPTISLSTPAVESGRQIRVSVRFDAPARAEGAGLLSVIFEPAVAGADDPAMVFAATNRRSVPFIVKPGELEGLFNNQAGALFQTGTTAGTLRFIAEMGGFRAELASTIPAAPVQVDSVSAVRGLNILELTVKGFDNTRTADEVAFVFYDRDGVRIPPGELRADVREAFSRYFESAPLGGLFSLRAVFPATGSTTAIAGGEVEFRNQAGVKRYRW